MTLGDGGVYLGHRHGLQAEEPVGSRRRSGPEPQGRQVPRPGLRAPEIPEPPEREAVRGQPFSLQRVLAGVQRARPQVLQDPRGALDEAPGEKWHSETVSQKYPHPGLGMFNYPGMEEMNI